MPFRGVADAEQLKVLTDVLDGHCDENHIEDSDERQAIGKLIMMFYASGMTDADSLSQALADYRAGRSAPISSPSTPSPYR